MTQKPGQPRPPWRRLRWWVLGYLLLLALSHGVRALRRPAPVVRDGPGWARLHAVKGDRQLESLVSVHYLDRAPAEERGLAPVLFLHGSPGSLHDQSGVQAVLCQHHRMITPDLPGFGASEHDVPDYSVAAHARYCLELLDQLEVDSAHLVGYSMGGAVALRMAEQEPGRVASLTLLAGLGVEELELFGDSTLNHTIHAGQLAAMWALVECVPHFGLLDRTFLGVPYARNFYDTDQSALRGILEAYDGPALILHGREDFLIPVEAAVEHHRILPQSELVLYPEGHFIHFSRARDVSSAICNFLDRVEAGHGQVRSTASPERLAAALEPFDPAGIPKAQGPALLLLFLLIGLATYITEDLTCVGVGLIIAQGRIGFIPGVLACVLGIFTGDMILYLIGRHFGRRALRVAPLKWVVNDSDLDAVSGWFERRGAAAIFLSRFLPGTRLLTYFAAGVARTSVLRFAALFLLAALIWTPILVGLAMIVGEQARVWFVRFEDYALWGAVGLSLLIVAAMHFLVPLFTRRGRRLLRGKWRRLVRWEYWPRWAIYPPVVVYILWLAVKHRGLRLVTAVNPAIPAGGLIGESKTSILQGFGATNPHVARFAPVPLGATLEEREAAVHNFLRRIDGDYPVVLKPDQGQRGASVKILRSPEDLRPGLEDLHELGLVQEFVPGPEFGLFYVRRPGEEHGRLTSITVKRMPHVTGDGERTIEDLILDDPRAVAQAQTYMRKMAKRLYEVPAPGEEVEIAELGTHSRGAIFLDGEELRTPALEEAVDRISKSFKGFAFGRYDVRTPSVEALQAGEFCVIELNGLTSESTHMYDPQHSLLFGWRTLCAQWREAFVVAQGQVEAGHRPASWGEIWRLIRGYKGRRMVPSKSPMEIL